MFLFYIYFLKLAEHIFYRLVARNKLYYYINLIICLISLSLSFSLKVCITSCTKVRLGICDDLNILSSNEAHMRHYIFSIVSPRCCRLSWSISTLVDYICTQSLGVKMFLINWDTL